MYFTILPPPPFSEVASHYKLKVFNWLWCRTHKVFIACQLQSAEPPLTGLKNAGIVYLQ